MSSTKTRHFAEKDRESHKTNSYVENQKLDQKLKLWIKSELKNYLNPSEFLFMLQMLRSSTENELLSKTVSLECLPSLISST